MNYMCTSENCNKTWSRLSGSVCPKCGTIHALGKAIEKINSMILKESDQLDVKHKQKEQIQ